MKIHLLSLVIGLVPLCANGRLLHFPIAGRDVVASSQRRALEAAVVDQDNVYQARGVQYVDLQVGKYQPSANQLFTHLSYGLTLLYLQKDARNRHRAPLLAPQVAPLGFLVLVAPTIAAKDPICMDSTTRSNPLVSLKCRVTTAHCEARSPATTKTSAPST